MPDVADQTKSFWLLKGKTFSIKILTTIPLSFWGIWKIWNDTVGTRRGVPDPMAPSFLNHLETKTAENGLRAQLRHTNHSECEVSWMENRLLFIAGL